MRFVLVLFASALLACSSSANSPARPPDPMETPPTTADPGAVQDEPNTPPSPPPEQGTQGSAADPTTPSGSGGGVAVSAGKGAGAACLISSDCESGVCEGQGCSDATPGKCAPRSRGCTRDLREYCGCDGKTFRSSGSCPGARFSAKSACP